MSQTPQDLQALLAAIASRTVATPQIIGGPLANFPQPLALPRETKAKILQEHYTNAKVKNIFKPGDLVQWKTGMQIRPMPAVDEPAIVLEVLPEPIYDGTTDSGLVSFREPLDLVLGCLGNQGQFLTFHFPSFRFEPFDQETSTSQQHAGAG